MRHPWRPLAAIAGSLALSIPAFAQEPWSVGAISPDGRWESNGRLLVDAPGERQALLAARDGGGGAYIAWRDTRDRAEGEIYLTRVGSNGLPIAPWSASGLRVREATSGTPRAWLVPGESGGAYVVVQDGSNPSVLHAHHYRPEATTAPGWPVGGLAITINGTPEKVFIPDVGYGGLSVVYSLHTADGYDQTWLRRWSFIGSALAPAAGTMVLGNSSTGSVPSYQPEQDLVEVIGDGKGRVYFAHEITPSTLEPYVHTLLQCYQGAVDDWEAWYYRTIPSPRMFGDALQGIVSFQQRSHMQGVYNGTLIIPNNPDDLGFVSLDPEQIGGAGFDGQGGLLYAGEKQGVYYAYRKNLAVLPLPTWFGQGVPLFPASEHALSFVVPDLRGGSFFGSVERVGAQYTLRSQRLLETGQFEPAWGGQAGSPIRVAEGQVNDVAAMLDGFGGYFVFWLDGRDGGFQLYGQSFGPPGFVGVEPGSPGH